MRIASRPNPYAVVARDEMQIHLSVMPEFDSANSYGSVIVVVPNADALYHSFAQGLRKAHCKLPVAGIPRFLRPRWRTGAICGFSVVDVGGNWFRVFQRADSPEPEGEAATGLAKTLEVTARLADAKGDDAAALSALKIVWCATPRLPLSNALRFKREM